MPERTLPGKVARIRRESDRVTEQLTVDISSRYSTGAFAPRAASRGLIRPAPRKVIALSSSATVQSPNGAGAWTVSNGRLRFRQARLGAVDPAGWIEVVQGFLSAIT